LFQILNDNSQEPPEYETGVLTTRQIDTMGYLRYLTNIR
jgi:hypothetical protein